MNDDRRASLETYLRLLQEDSVSRRDFVKLLGASMALAGINGCTRMPAEKILPYVNQPELTPGVPRHYATAMTLDGYGTGVIAESHEGRPTKIEGNPDHPASLGAAGIFEQASVLELYDPHRARTVRRGRDASSWNGFLSEFAPQNLKTRVGAGGERLRLLMEPTSSRVEAELIQRLLQLYPGMGVHFYAPLADAPGSEPFRAGSRALIPHYDFAAADVIVAVDSDFLSTGPFHLRYTRDFATRRRPETASRGMNRLYVVESSVTVTGSVADHRLAVRPSEIEIVLEELLGRLGGASAAQEIASGTRTGSSASSGFVAAMARDLAAHRGAGIVAGGSRLSARAQSLVSAINEALGNSGKTVWFTESPLIGAGDPRSSMPALLSALSAGQVDALVCLGGNPSYATAGVNDFSRLLRRVPQTMYSGLFENETARDCNWMVPAAHYLESWGDTRAYDGTLSIVQPLIAPLYDGKTKTQILAALLGDSASSAHDLLRASWGRNGGSEADWRNALGRGVVAGPALARVASPSASIAASSTRSAQPPLADRAANGVEIAFRADTRVHDGSFADNPWLQELPDPVTTETWGNAAHLSATTARRLGIVSGDVVEIRANQRSIKLPALVVPGHADDVVTLRLGYGRSGSEATAVGSGMNVYPLFSGSLSEIHTADVRGTGEHKTLALTQEHWSLEPHTPARAIPLGEVQRSVTPKASRVLSLYQAPSALPDRQTEHQWAMTVDLSACIGCGACVIACQAENNIPVVGVDDVRKGREMHWLRIDRYVSQSGDRQHDIDVVTQPMLCQHCEKAPCEYVCPVEATVHSADGLNEMVYNRCVGTRFCSNNCPYKVRRFNWFDYNRELAETEKMVKNPDVTVRERGVMEKCTFCVQRIREAEITASTERRALRTDEVRTACQQTCPANAIVFGSLTDVDSAVHRERDGVRAYAALGDLGTQPRVRYLARVRNPNPELRDS